MSSRTAVSWGRYGWLTAAASRLRPTLGPSVLVVSLPRSGSSWVGWMLGSAPDALYLREPFTQGDPEINRKIVFDPYDTPELEPKLRKLADKAFHGVPDFPTEILQCPEQWDFSERSHRRVVIKEVNPRACRWFVNRYRPRVVFLLRNPGAVCWSSQREGWLGKTVEDWRIRGTEDAESLQSAWEILKDDPDATTVFYEALCENPIAEYRKLYAFAGLTWNDEVEKRVVIDSAPSLSRRDAWRAKADPEAVAALREGFESVGLEWYRGDDAWRLNSGAAEPQPSTP